MWTTLESPAEEDNEPVIVCLIEQAGPWLFNFSILEVTDIDDGASAIMAIVEHFGPLPMDLIEKHFEILQKIREHITN
jgi:hypothetical protein